MKSNHSKVIRVTSEVFTRDELRRYEEKILDNKNLTEREASRFFQDFPKFSYRPDPGPSA